MMTLIGTGQHQYYVSIDQSQRIERVSLHRQRQINKDRKIAEPAFELPLVRIQFISVSKHLSRSLNFSCYGYTFAYYGVSLGTTTGQDKARGWLTIWNTQSFLRRLVNESSYTSSISVWPNCISVEKLINKGKKIEVGVEEELVRACCCCCSPVVYKLRRILHRAP